MKQSEFVVRIYFMNFALKFVPPLFMQLSANAAASFLPKTRLENKKIKITPQRNDYNFVSKIKYFVGDVEVK